MEWQGRRESTNIEDRRGQSGAGGGPGGFGGSGLRLPISGRGGIGMVVVVLIIAWLTGTNPLALIGLVDSGGGSQSSSTGPVGAPTDLEAKFVATVLADTEDSWGKTFRDMGRSYSAPILVLFKGSTRSGCGGASAASGPFYCPADQKLYLDLSFFQELSSRFGAPGEFAEAYVIAHEVGHHVQNLLGSINAEGSRQGAQSQSVRTELQADCFAGIFALAERSQGYIKPSEIDQALTAAAAVGDDTLQKKSQGYAVPETFTHGTSDQRKRWFTRGFQSGKVSACDTFSADQL